MRLITSDRRITESAVINLVDCPNGQVVKPPPPEVLPAQARSSRGRVGMP